ncbi:Ff.00g065620.m01.CDS01 [Fusarium sp. VM40]|nr:Ff.00g065620.m01.CDS01 [Fusarium sp. VM40]
MASAIVEEGDDDGEEDTTSDLLPAPLNLKESPAEWQRPARPRRKSVSWATTNVLRSRVEDLEAENNQVHQDNEEKTAALEKAHAENKLLHDAMALTSPPAQVAAFEEQVATLRKGQQKLRAEVRALLQDKAALHQKLERAARRCCEAEIMAADKDLEIKERDEQLSHALERLTVAEKGESKTRGIMTERNLQRLRQELDGKR